MGIFECLVCAIGPRNIIPVLGVSHIDSVCGSDVNVALSRIHNPRVTSDPQMSAHKSIK